MKRKIAFFVLLVCVAVPTWAGPSKEMVQLMQMVQDLTTQVHDLNRLMTERLAIMNSLVEKTSDNTNRLQTSIDNVQRNLQAAIAAQGQKIDSHQSHLQALTDSIDDVKSRQARLGEQLAQIKQLMETMNTPAPAPVQPAQPVVVAPPPPPPAGTLYQNALTDLLGGKTDSALTGFQDYLKFYPEGERAENSQFYIGEIHYQRQEYSQAVDIYTLVIDSYPKGTKTASAHLKKGFALLEMKRKDDGVKELRTLIKRFPNSTEARLAQERLKNMGLSANGSPPPGRRR